MTELTPSDIIKFVQKATILKHQVDELEKLLDTYGEERFRPDPWVVTELYNKILNDSRKLFVLDNVFVDAISHLKEAKILTEGSSVDQWAEVRKLFPQLKILKGTLDAFFEWLKHKEKKETT